MAVKGALQSPAKILAPVLRSHESGKVKCLDRRVDLATYCLDVLDTAAEENCCDGLEKPP